MFTGARDKLVDKCMLVYNNAYVIKSFYINSKGTFLENSTVNFIHNTVKGDGGAACLGNTTHIMLGRTIQNNVQ